MKKPAPPGERVAGVVVPILGYLSSAPCGIRIITHAITSFIIIIIVVVVGVVVRFSPKPSCGSSASDPHVSSSGCRAPESAVDAPLHWDHKPFLTSF